MMTIVCLLALTAFVSAILALMGKLPVTIPVLILSVCELIHCIPLK